ATVLTEVLELVEAVEVLDRHLGDRPRLGEAQVDSDAAPAVLVRLQAAPVRDAAAGGAEVEAERIAAHVGGRRPGDADAGVFPVVGPEHAVPATGGAVAGGRRVGQ